MNERTMLSILATPDTASIRTAQHMNVEHTIIPVIALVEGVLWPHNAPSPELALAEEFGRFPDGWNGRPVMMDHPKVNGMAVSASSPAILEASTIGQMFNTVLTEDNKLKSEIWINMDRLNALDDDLKASAQRLIDGDATVEVSTGLFMQLEEAPGKFKDDDFSGIWRNIVPDHLAILPEGVTGACSVADGCGAPRTQEGKVTTSNKFHFNSDWQPVMRAAMMTTVAVAPCTGDCGAGSGCDCDPELKQNKGIFQRLLEAFGGALDFISPKISALSDLNVRDALNTALGSVEADSWYYVLAVFEEGGDSGNSGTVVYELGGSIYQRTFDIPNDTGVVALSNDRMAVRPVTQFVPVEIVANEGNKDTGGLLEEFVMNRAELIASLVSNAATNFTIEDTAWLTSLDDANFAKLLPVVIAAAPAPVSPDAKVVPTATTEPGAATTGDAEPKVAQTAEEFIKSAPAEIAALLHEGMTLQSARKNKIITGLIANERCKFTESDLKAKSLSELENLAILSNGVTFEGAGAVSNDGLRDNTKDAEPNFTAAPLMFKPASAA